jgi:MoxR-like ATPase
VNDAGLTLSEVTDAAMAVLDEVGRAVLGKRDALELVLASLLSNGHVLMEDLPGLAKTLIARSFAQVIDLTFARVQFTPDLLPSDLTGSSVFDQRTSEFVFRPGPIFTNLLLGDEINRAPPKTQAALLEAMQERQVTVDGVSRALDAPFLVVATQNPIEFEGTYPLPEAQLDRFAVRVAVGYPDEEAEVDMLARRRQRKREDIELRTVVTREEFLAMQQAIEDVFVSDSIERYIVALVAATRSRPTVDVGASPRGSLALMLLSRAHAVLRGRDFVVPEDLKSMAVPVLAHRLRLRADLWVRGASTVDVIAECLREVPTPSAEDASRP